MLGISSGEVGRNFRGLRRQEWWRRPNIVSVSLKALWRILGWLFGVLVIAVLVLWLLWRVPVWLANGHVSGVTGSVRASLIQQATESFRGELITLLGGVLVAGALYFTARNFVLSRHTLELSQRTLEENSQLSRRALELTEQGQVTDRYIKAIEQLGSDKLDVRVGGIYALERIAGDSAQDHPTVMEVLATFVREHSREPWRLAVVGSDVSSEAKRATRPDVQAAVTVIARRDAGRDTRTVDLAGADLTRADLRGAPLQGANIRGAILIQAVGRLMSR